MNKRESGYYWVKSNDKWIIAEWLPLCQVWASIEYADKYKDSDFDEIDERRIVRQE